MAYEYWFASMLELVLDIVDDGSPVGSNIIKRSTKHHFEIGDSIAGTVVTCRIGICGTSIVMVKIGHPFDPQRCVSEATMGEDDRRTGFIRLARLTNQELQVTIWCRDKLPRDVRWEWSQLRVRLPLKIVDTLKSGEHGESLPVMLVWVAAGLRRTWRFEKLETGGCAGQAGEYEVSKPLPVDQHVTRVRYRMPSTGPRDGSQSKPKVISILHRNR